jgi:hypothetical protein
LLGLGCPLDDEAGAIGIVIDGLAVALEVGLTGRRTLLDDGAGRNRDGGEESGANSSDSEFEGRDHRGRRQEEAKAGLRQDTGSLSRSCLAKSLSQVNLYLFSPRGPLDLFPLLYV